MAGNMEFLGKNLLNTTSMVLIDSGTSTVQYLFDKNRNIGYGTLGYDSTTATVLSVEFAQPTVLSNIILQTHNLKSFSIFYDSATANSLYSTTTNSATNNYIEFASVTVSSIQLQMNEATAAVERSIGELVITEREIEFERNPSVDNFKPILFRQQVKHSMPDGGMSLYNIRDKYRSKLSWKFITSSFHSQLLSIYEGGDELYFVPWPTTTSWDGAAYSVVWIDDFDFRHSSNDKQQGYSGSIDLRETPSG